MLRKLRGLAIAAVTLVALAQPAISLAQNVSAAAPNAPVVTAAQPAAQNAAAAPATNTPVASGELRVPVTVTPPTAPQVNAVPAVAPQPAAPARALVPPPNWFVYATMALIVIAVLIGISSVRSALTREGRWSIADALSEEAEVVVLDSSGVPLLGPDQKAVTAPRMVASSSRFIAFIGLFAILALYAGFGSAVLYFFITGQGIPPGIDDIRNFLLAGLTLFAPYIVNKFTSIFNPSTHTGK